MPKKSKRAKGGEQMKEGRISVFYRLFSVPEVIKK
jgi:hypothetical protein